MKLSNRIKLESEYILNDEVIKEIEASKNGDTHIVIAMRVLALESQSYDCDTPDVAPSISFDPVAIATAVGKPVDVVAEALAVFEAKNMVVIKDNRLFWNDWAKHIDDRAIEYRRKGDNARQDKCRANRRAEAEKKALEEGVSRDICHVTKDDCHVTGANEPDKEAAEKVFSEEVLSQLKDNNISEYEETVTTVTTKKVKRKTAPFWESWGKKRK